MSLAIVGSVVSIGAGLNSMGAFGGDGGGGGGGGGGSGGGVGGNTYVPTGSGGADQSWQDMLKQMQGGINGQTAQLSPDLLAAYQNMMKQYGPLATQMQGFGNTLAGNATTAFGDAGTLKAGGDALFNMGMDPQKAMYNQYMQNTQDTSRAGTSMRGIGMGAESAGIENQAVNNFNNQWQDKQVARAAQGLQGQTGAYDAAGRMSQLGNADLTGSVTMNQGAAQLPFAAANAYSAGMNQGVYGPESGMMGQIIPYLYAGQGAAGQAFGQGQTNLNNITTGAGQIGNWLTSQFGGGGSLPGNGYTNPGGYTDSGYPEGGG